MSQQLCDLQCQFMALVEKERASSNFKKEALEMGFLGGDVRWACIWTR